MIFLGYGCGLFARGQFIILYAKNIASNIKIVAYIAKMRYICSAI